MTYEYSGFLKTVLEAPDPSLRDSLPFVEFTADEIAKWRLSDVPYEMEWQRIPGNCFRTETGVRIEGRFNEVSQIDNIAVDDPSFWFPVSTLDYPDPRLPIDVTQYPVAEITYRCTSANALPAWQWLYPGGVYFDALEPTQEWRTIIRRVSYNGFPKQVDALILRLYSTTRDVESFEVKSIRFRAMSEAEAAACTAASVVALPEGRPPKRYPVLDEFFPFGCYMDAASSKRMASMLGVSLHEYWSLALEDIAKHHHNCIAIEKVDRFSADEWRELLALAGSYGVKFFVMHAGPVGATPAQMGEFLDTHVRPYADSNDILAWALYDSPPEHAYPEVMSTKALLETTDPAHPMGLMLRTPNAFPLFAPALSVMGIEHFRSHVPWDVADILQTHLPLCGGQQMWVIAPGFVYATDTPEWHSCPELRMMLNHALANGARGWFTFAYHNDPIWIRGSIQRSLTGPFLTFSDLWSELGQRVEQCSAIAPLFLNVEPVPDIAPWFKITTGAHANSHLPNGVEPACVTQLSGADCDVFCIVSNDVREMTSVSIEIAEGVRGKKVYDLSDCIRTRRWTQMPAQSHFQMFPGQMHVILTGQPGVCDLWRDRIAARTVANDRRVMEFDLALLHVHGIATAEIDDMLADVSSEGGPRDLETMQHARDALLNLVYNSPAIYEARTKLIEACAAVCACDGSLCRLLGRSKVELARQWGFKVTPLAREFTSLRLELRRGRGAEIIKQCEDLARRTHKLLAEIRALS